MVLENEMRGYVGRADAKNKGAFGNRWQNAKKMVKDLYTDLTKSQKKGIIKA